VRRSLVPLAVLAAAVLVAGAAGAPRPAGAILAVDADGQIFEWPEPAAGTNPVAIGRSPAWSPSGRSFAYFQADCGKPCVFDVRIADEDGRHDRLLAVAGEETGGLSWSPDGSRLVYSTGPFAKGGGCVCRLYVVPAKGGPSRRLVGADGTSNVDPAWSPRGPIAFTRCAGAACTLYTLRSDGTHAARLTRLAGNETEGEWSRGGSRLAFVRNGRIEEVDAEGGGDRVLVPGRYEPGVVAGRDAAGVRGRPDGRDLRLGNLDREPEDREVAPLRGHLPRLRGARLAAGAASVTRPPGRRGDVELRRWRRGDAAAPHAACRDNLGRTLDGLPVRPVGGGDARTRPGARGRRNGVAVVDEGDRLLGSSGLLSVDRERSIGLVGYWVAPEATVDVGNEASQRVLERAGLRRDGPPARSTQQIHGEWIVEYRSTLVPADRATPLS